MRLFLWLLLLSASAWADPVDSLVARLGQTHGLWLNGVYPTLELPATASNEELLARLDKSATLVSAREVTIPGQPERYRALRVKTAQGPRILLLRYEGKSGWWSRFYGED